MATPKKTDEELHPENYFISPVGHKRDRIIINESPEIPKEGLFVSLNGYPFLIKPGVEVDVPRPIRELLDTRIKTETTQDDQGRDHNRHMRRITYILVKEDIDSIPAAEVIDQMKDDVSKSIFP